MHDKWDCATLTLHLQERKVRLNEKRRICSVVDGQEYRMNIGKGGIMALAVGEGHNRQRRSEDEVPTIGETYAVTLCGDSGRSHVTKSKLMTKGDLQAAAEQVRGLTGWDCPVDASSFVLQCRS